MNKIHHPQTRFERLKIREQKQQKDRQRDNASHVKKRLAIEALKAEEAQDELTLAVDQGNFAR